MTSSGLPDLFEASKMATDSARHAFERTVHEHMPTPAVPSSAAADWAFADQSWHPGAGRAPLGIGTLLLSGASSVLTEFGDLVGSRRGPVTGPTLCRYVIEHIAEILWILAPGSYTTDDGDPTGGLTDEESEELFHSAQLTRIRRAWVRTYAWTLEFENGRFKPEPSHPRPKNLPLHAPSDLERLLEPHGLMPKKGKLPPSQMDPDKKAKSHRWTLGSDASDESTTAKVDALAARYLTERRPEHAGLYSFLSTSTHPNPFAISEVGGSGLFQRPASEMARLVTVAVGAFALGLELVNSYAGWDLTEVRELNDLVHRLAGYAEGQDLQDLSSEPGSSGSPA